MIFVESKRKKVSTLIKKYSDAEIIDLTSTAPTSYIKFSPFYPHGNIPIPFSENQFGASVEGIWQGLKVFEKQGIDSNKFLIRDMKNIKRSSRVNGPVLGHRKGITGTELLDYGQARIKIYMKCYGWVLENKLQELINQLLIIAIAKNIVFLDYETNIDIENLHKPLSHAGLVKLYMEKKNSLIMNEKISQWTLF